MGMTRVGLEAIKNHRRPLARMKMVARSHKRLRDRENLCGQTSHSVLPRHAGIYGNDAVEVYVSIAGHSMETEERPIPSTNR